MCVCVCNDMNVSKCVCVFNDMNVSKKPSINLSIFLM